MAIYRIDNHPGKRISDFMGHSGGYFRYRAQTVHLFYFLPEVIHLGYINEREDTTDLFP